MRVDVILVVDDKDITDLLFTICQCLTALFGNVILGRACLCLDGFGIHEQHAA